MKLLAISKNSLMWVAMVCVGLAGTSSAQIDEVQRVLHVRADATGLGDGLSWSTAYNSLQDALSIAEAGDQIWVAAGTYMPAGGQVSRSATFRLKSGVGIFGGFAGTEAYKGERDPTANVTVLSGDLLGNDGKVTEPRDLAEESTRSENSYHVVTGNGADATARLDGFVITGGNANGNGSEDAEGGGLINVAAEGSNGRVRNGQSGPTLADATIANCTFEWNFARARGGGMFNTGGDVTLLNCTFRDNHVNGTGPVEHGGGGLYNLNASPMLSDCTFQGNTTRGRGAGLYNLASAPSIDHSLFTDNAVLGNGSTGVGGGVLNRQGSAPDIRDCVFKGNTASHGGGMMNATSSQPTVTHCLFARNRATFPANGRGGGMQNYSGRPTVVNCTFSQNTAVDSRSSGLGAFNGASPVVTNCIFWGNTAADYGHAVSQFGGENAVRVIYSCVEGGYTGDGNMSDDPLFADLENGDYRLMSQAGRWNPLAETWETDAITSPCIDAGDHAEPIGLESFPTGGFVNMGAYGGTAEASRSYFGGAPCNAIVAGDINGDCQVDRLDLEIMTLNWTDDPSLAP